MSVTGLAGMYNIKKLIPYLHPPDEIFAGIPAVFTLSVRNNKRYLTSFLIHIEHHAGKSLVFPVVPPNSAINGTVILTFNQRGQEQIGRITISSPYPVGFFTRFWSYEINNTFTVFPRPIPSNLQGNGEESVAAGTNLRRERGLSGEVERIYPYTGVEPLRMIHWKHSARSQDLMIKGFGRSVVVPLVIDLDSLAGEGVEERLSLATWLVLNSVYERPVGIKFRNRSLPAGIGRRHCLMLLKELALYDSN